ncbi:MAG: ribosome biogenesis GTPase YlqF, partial [Clostridia bacterium]
IYVLDARAPLSCFNPKFQELIGFKPIIYVLNKNDLADESRTLFFKNKLTSDKSDCIVLNSTQSGTAKILEKHIKNLAKEKIERYELKGVKIILKSMVVGVPNSGKSSLVNNLCKEAKALTGNKPGVTRAKQWVKVSQFLEVLDTPGTLWPSFDNDKVAKNLAYIGSIKEEVLDANALTLDFISDVEKLYPGTILKRYGIITDEKSALEILEEIAKSRKFLIRGGEIDYDRACLAVLDDFRKGRLGRISLE